MPQEGSRYLSLPISIPPMVRPLIKTCKCPYEKNSNKKRVVINAALFKSLRTRPSNDHKTDVKKIVIAIGTKISCADIIDKLKEKRNIMGKIANRNG
jgi:hypothetical protein